MTTDSRPPAMTAAELVKMSVLHPHFVSENRNAAIVQMHDHDHMSFEAIGRIYGITRQRAHQIYKAALKKRRK